MSVNKKEKQELLEKLNELIRKQSLFQQEINELRLEITTLQVDDSEELTTTDEAFQIRQTIEETRPPEIRKPSVTERITIAQQIKKESFWEKSGISIELEKFIGENLINKIGIAVLIIGVGIGVKYAIDNDLISPLVRIILGYLVGITLSVFAIRLKNKYLNFSAVLFSGSMAVYYFITYAAYSYYNLFPQIASIIIMVLITTGTVYLALFYKKQVIAHFGLVGAYIIPYVLKEPFANVSILFSYMAIINCGILIIAIRKQWKPLNFLALIATWIIFISWYSSTNYQQQLGTCLTFLFIFFAIFRLLLIPYKLLHKENLKTDDIIFLLLNSAIFFIIGYTAINQIEEAKAYLGLFTFINALIYSLTALLVQKLNPSDTNQLRWNIALAIAFITLAVSVQLDNYETAIIWAFEAAIIFLFGRSNRNQFFETISYFVILALFFITTSNLTTVHYGNLNKGFISQIFTTVFNKQFLASFITVCLFSSIFLASQLTQSKLINNSSTPEVFKILFPLAFFVVLYFTFFTEINLYWENRQIETCFSQNDEGAWVNQSMLFNPDLISLKNIWLLNYTLGFAAIFSFINFKWLKKDMFAAFNLIFHALVILLFLVFCITWIDLLFASYMNPEANPNFSSNSFYLIIRYLDYLLFAILCYSAFVWILPILKIKILYVLFDIVICIAIVRISSSELISWLSVSGSENVYKYGLSILWGIISLLLVGYGIWKKKKHLRITGISLFAITLAKLFFYDLTNLETIPKTLVFILTGGLLLVVSFLYNKYTKVIFEEN